MAGNLLMSVSKDERERAVYRSRRMYQTDMQSNIATAEDRGRREGALAIARNMFKRNRPIDEIIEDTGLTREEVENLSI
jgi:predicted transposase/invertase (TIGR01784 family)